MDVVLQTNAADPRPGLFDIAVLPAGSGLVAKLRVCSSGLMLDRCFYFDEGGLADFVKAIAEMDRILAGSAELRT